MVFAPCVVFSMRQDFLDENFLESVPNDDDHAIMVSGHVKNDVRRYVIRGAEPFTHMVEIPEIDVLDQRVPQPQRGFGLWMFSPEFAQRLE